MMNTIVAVLSAFSCSSAVAMLWMLLRFPAARVALLGMTNGLMIGGALPFVASAPMAAPMSMMMIGALIGIGTIVALLVALFHFHAMCLAMTVTEQGD